MPLDPLPPLTPAPVLLMPQDFYQEISLDELSAVELKGKLAELLALPANQIHRLFHRGPGGIFILSDHFLLQVPMEALLTLLPDSAFFPMAWLVLFGSNNKIAFVPTSLLQVVQNFKDKSYFVAVVKKVQNPDGYYLVLI
uniref:transcription factor CP2-like protein 1 isoform X1 n=1 Tax=Macaca mulatta TaxID=9544 RepID=UPI0010A29151|nr:transcription factor CP2-like protein 1 isoform X1 [Macaca mulatta]